MKHVERDRAQYNVRVDLTDAECMAMTIIGLRQRSPNLHKLVGDTMRVTRAIIDLQANDAEIIIRHKDGREETFSIDRALGERERLGL